MKHTFMWQKNQSEAYQTELSSFHMQVVNNSGIKHLNGHFFLLTTASFNQLFPTAFSLQWDNRTPPGHCVLAPQCISNLHSACLILLCTVFLAMCSQSNHSVRGLNSKLANVIVSRLPHPFLFSPLPNFVRTHINTFRFQL